MKITRRQFKKLVEGYLLFEAVHDKAAREVGLTDPDRIEQLRIASEKPHKLQKPELLWIAKYFNTPAGSNTEEPIEDIVAAIKSLAQNKAALLRRGSKTSLEDYESPGQIVVAVTLSRGFVPESELADQVDVLYEDDNWKVSMPHTKEASCTIGRGTAWCTANPGAGNNLFYNYVISGRKILYYVVKKNPQEGEKRRTTHFSLGTKDGTIPFPEKEGQGNGGIVVDGDNSGLTRNRFLSQVGNQIGETMIAIIENHSQKNRNKHPAMKKVIEMARNPALYNVEMRGKSIDVRYDFTGMMIQFFFDVVFRGDRLNADGTTVRGRLRGDLTDGDIVAMNTALIDPNSQLNISIARATEIQQKDLDRASKAELFSNREELEKWEKIIEDGDSIQGRESYARDLNGQHSPPYRFCRNLKQLESVLGF